MGIDHETERPAEQPAAADSTGTAGAAGTDQASDEPVTAEPVASDGHSEEWLANQRKAAEKIRAMFKS